MSDINSQHFLDTTIARLQLLGTTHYKTYLKEQFGEDTLYISKYVQMEFNRGYLCILIDFYFWLRLPTIESIGDAIILWSNKFRGAEHKSVAIMMGDLATARKLSKTDPRDKNKTLKIIGDYIRRMYLLFSRRYKDVGINATRCNLATMKLSDNSHESITNFRKGFDETKICRENCKIDDFFLKSYPQDIEKYINNVEKLPTSKTSKRNIGFVKIAEELKKTKESNGSNLSCRTCGKIGDAVIALEMPMAMRLETLDNSFNHLMPPIGKVHFQHPSEIAKHQEGKSSL